MAIEPLNSSFEKFKENALFGRYITNDHILPLIDKLSKEFRVEVLGNSVNGEPITSIRIGNGPTKVLMWSQMHGNESTTTKALFDLFNFLSSQDTNAAKILESCTLTIVPILNPDGARSYTRVNANTVDLNRDAQDLSQPESVILRRLFDKFLPHYCFNLHGQRTIFSAGATNKPATVSFLSPSQDDYLTITKNRKVAMEVIASMNKHLQKIIPNQVGIYDDAFNINCVGDTFQSFGVPTILFEAGHFPDDYMREQTRMLIYESYLVSLLKICSGVEGEDYEDYFKIPMNEKLFYDIILRSATVEDHKTDIAVQLKEVLDDDKVIFSPIIEKIGELSSFYGHREVNVNGALVSTMDLNQIYVGYENDFALLNNEKFQLNLIKS